MRDLARNTFQVHYKLYLGQKEIVDENGYPTGSFGPQYGEMQTARLSVSPNKGTAETDMFGTLEEYDRTMVTADTACPIDEDSILWLDGHDVNDEHNYVVQKRAPWKNTIAFAIKKVKVSG